MAHYGNEEKKGKYWAPLLERRIASGHSMTGPRAGADPAEFTCRAAREGNEWVIDGEKWFASQARFSEFLRVMLVTHPEVPIHRGRPSSSSRKAYPGCYET